jgi:hypothetical protein
MSPSEADRDSFAALASEVSVRCAEAIENDRLGDIPDDSLGQLLGSVARLFAAKAQAGNTPRPFGRNSGVAITDVAITCTAMMESVGLGTFELGAWQSMSGLGRQAAPKIDRTPEGGN